MISRVMSRHQLMQTVVVKKLLLNKEIDVPKELPLNMEMEVAKELPLNMGIEVTKELPLNREVEVTQVLPLNREMDILKELPLNMEMEVAKELPLNMGMEVDKELPLSKEVKVTMEPRKGDRRSKEATQLHNTALPCSIVHCRVPQPKTTCSYAVVNLITHTGQINYFRFALCFVNINASLHYFCGASGYEP